MRHLLASFFAVLTVLTSSIPVGPLQAHAATRPGQPMITGTGERQIVTSSTVSLSWTLWWGEPGMFWYVEENGVKVYEASLPQTELKVQSGEAQLENQALGSHSYEVFLCNDLGCNKSPKPLQVLIQPIASNSVDEVLITPGKPVITWIPPESVSGSYSISWVLPDGEQGDRWFLKENGQVLYRGTLIPNPGTRQQGFYDVMQNQTGSYEYIVDVCRRSAGGQNVCTSSDPFAVEVLENAQHLKRDVNPFPIVEVDKGKTLKQPTEEEQIEIDNHQLERFERREDVQTSLQEKKQKQEEGLQQVATFLQAFSENLEAYQHDQCYAGWSVYGLFTPVENDYQGVLMKIDLDSGEELFVRSDFLRDLNSYGTGRLRNEGYIGYDGTEYFLLESLQDVQGKALQSNRVAVNTRYVPNGGRFVLPNLPSGLNQLVFEAFQVEEIDTSTAKSIAVYTGEGRLASQYAQMLNHERQKLCRLAPVKETVEEPEQISPQTEPQEQLLGIVPFAERDLSLVASFPEWGVYSDLRVEDIPTEWITHVNYSFAHIRDGQVVVGDEFAALQKTSGGQLALNPDQPYAGYFWELRQLKERTPELKILISVGGLESQAEFAQLLASPSSRQRFIQSVEVFLSIFDFFDGVDLAWVGPELADAQLAQSYLELVQEMRTTLEDQVLLTVSYPVFSLALENDILPALSEQVEYINLLAYDYHGPWEPTTNHQSPLYRSQFTPEKPGSVDETIQKVLQMGIPSQKIHMGVSFYGRSYADVHSLQPIGAPASGPGSGAGSTGILSVEDIRENVLGQGANQLFWDSTSSVPFVYNTVNGEWISFDNDMSLGLKAVYAQFSGLGGAYIWDLKADHDQLIRSFSRALFNVEVAGIDSESPFLDLEADDPNFQMVSQAVSAGWLKGFPDGSIRLDDPISRAEFLSLVMTAFALPTPALPEEVEAVAADVPREVWFAPVLYSAQQFGMIKGYQDGTLRPADALIRVDALRMVLDLLRLDYSAVDEQYADTPSDAWFSGYTSFSYQQELLPSPDGNLYPWSLMKRRDAIELIYRITLIDLSA